MPAPSPWRIPLETALHADPRVRAIGPLLRTRQAGSQLILEGTVESLAEKRICEQLLTNRPDLPPVESRLQVRAVPVRGDAEILAHLRDGLEADPYLDHRRLAYSVDRGVVTLAGEQDALAKKRLAGSIAWWVAGVTDVRNRIAVRPEEADSDDEITTAVRVAFDKDPLVDTLRYQVATRQGVVYLGGVASSPIARQAAEDDAWGVWGVQDVQNQITLEA